MVISKKGELRKREIKSKNGITNPVYLNESMCSGIKKLFYQCKQLKAAGKLAYYAFNNGSLKVKKSEGEHRKHHVSHISDLAKVTGLTIEEIEAIVDPAPPQNFSAGPTSLLNA